MIFTPVRVSEPIMWVLCENLIESYKIKRFYIAVTISVNSFL